MAKKAARLVALAAVVVLIVGSIYLIQGPLSSSQGSIGLVGSDVGNVAPDFSLVSLNGEIVSLSQFRGKPVVLNFWASWCPSCVEELPTFETAKQEFGDSVVILAVNRAEPISTQRTFLSSFPFKLTINFLTDSADSVARLYDVNVLPTTFFIDSDGVIVDKQLSQISWHELENKIQPMLSESRKSTP